MPRRETMSILCCSVVYIFQIYGKNRQSLLLYFCIKYSYPGIARPEGSTKRKLTILCFSYGDNNRLPDIIKAQQNKKFSVQPLQYYVREG